MELRGLKQAVPRYHPHHPMKHRSMPDVSQSWMAGSELRTHSQEAVAVGLLQADPLPARLKMAVGHYFVAGSRGRAQAEVQTYLEAQSAVVGEVEGDLHIRCPGAVDHQGVVLQQVGTLVVNHQEC